MKTSAVFSPDFATARERFRRAATAVGGRLEELPLAARGPAGEPLGIDVAWLGAERPRRVLLHSSGLHGVEGFAGSAVQLRLLETLPSIPSDAAIVFLHVLNPYGMAWLRRFNENNVDLNRNFLAPGEEFRGAADAYRALNTFLNPGSPPRRFDGFLLRAVTNIARFGYQNLKQAIAEGQYEFPQGLFYGGGRHEATTEVLLAWRQARLAGAERLFAIDVHTGLGRSGEDSLLIDYAAESAPARRLCAVLGERVQAWRPSGVAYQIRGGYLQALEREAQGAAVLSVCQEFGTHPPLEMLYALREENRQHHWGDPHKLAHPAKRRLVESFCPESEAWRTKLLRRGEELFATVLRELL